MSATVFKLLIKGEMMESDCSDKKEQMIDVSTVDPTVVERLVNDLIGGGRTAVIAFEQLSKLPHNAPQVYYALGVVFEKFGTIEDNNIASDYHRKAIKMNYVPSTQRLFDILWRIGTPTSYDEMIALARPLAESGNRELHKTLAGPRGNCSTYCGGSTPLKRALK